VVSLDVRCAFVELDCGSSLALPSPPHGSAGGSCAQRVVGAL